MTAEELKWERRFYDRGGLSAVYFLKSLYNLIDELEKEETGAKGMREAVLKWGLGVLPIY